MAEGYRFGMKSYPVMIQWKVSEGFFVAHMTEDGKFSVATEKWKMAAIFQFQLGSGFNDLIFFTLEEMIQLGEHTFSNGLVQPPTTPPEI